VCGVTKFDTRVLIGTFLSSTSNDLVLSGLKSILAWFSTLLFGDSFVVG
jgi:hypothetical protein